MDARVPVEVVAHRNKANKYRVGLGYATDTGPRLSLDWRRRYWNRWGHQSRTELVLSPGYSSFEFDYRIPIRDPERDYVTIKPQVTYYDTATSKGWLNTIQFARSIVTPGGWRRTLGLDYRYEDYTINDVETSAANELIPYVTWSKTNDRRSRLHEARLPAEARGLGRRRRPDFSNRLSQRHLLTSSGSGPSGRTIAFLPALTWGPPGPTAWTTCPPAAASMRAATTPSGVGATTPWAPTTPRPV